MEIQTEKFGKMGPMNEINDRQPNQYSRNGDRIFGGKKSLIPKRYILILMGFFGYQLIYMLRVNLSVTIVSMVKSANNSNNDNNQTNEPNIGTNYLPNSSTVFNWNENTQGLILSSFFIGYVITQYPGGRLADTFGSKWLFGIGLLFTSIFTIISPIAANIHYLLFIGCRIMEGLFEGLAYPCMHSMLAKWIPLHERSRMATFMYSGTHIGTVITMPVAALLCDTSMLGGWPSVFYIFGALGLIWCSIWFLIIYENPESHPSIANEELQLILTKRNNDSMEKKPRLPWKEIVTSAPLWALVCAHFGQNWGFYTLLTQLPRYFNKVLHFDIKKNGFVSALPYLCQALVGCLAGYICDKLYSNNYFKLSTLRKAFNTISFVGPTICLLILIHFGSDNSTLCIVLFTIGLGINGMCLAGYHVTHVDMSPTFASSLMGITNCLANLAGILAPYVVGIILTETNTTTTATTTNTTIINSTDTTIINTDNRHQEQNLNGWNYVFYLSCLIYVSTAIIFILFGSNEKQIWDQPKQNRTEKMAEESGLE